MGAQARTDGRRLRAVVRAVHGAFRAYQVGRNVEARDVHTDDRNVSLDAIDHRASAVIEGGNQPEDSKHREHADNDCRIDARVRSKEKNR